MHADIRPNWWQRNWKWFVPVGCLSLILIAVAFVGLIVFGIFGLMKQAEPYQQALHAAQRHPAVIATLGQPIEAGAFVSGSIQVNDDEGSAKFSIPISGPKGEAKIYVEATKERGDWIYQTMDAHLGPGADIDLRADAAPTPPPSPSP